MKSSKSNNVSTAISAILILIITVAALGFFIVRTDSFTTPLKDFYVSYKKDNIIGDRENMDIVLGKEYKFDIHSSENVDGSTSKYIVTIKPNDVSAAKFTFEADGEQIEYSSMTSLAKGFSIAAYDDYFVLTANKDLPDMLSLYYPTKTLSGVPSAIDTNVPYFRLTIQSADKSETINVNFNLRSE